MPDFTRCKWCEKTEIERNYHDNEWGVPLFDDTKLFEFLILDAFQAGLSWLTILKKRENFRLAFDNFDANIIANYDDEKFDELMNNTGIIRNKLKIKAAITNAKKFLEIQTEFGSFSKYIWQFTGGKTIVNNWEDFSQVPAKTIHSDAMSKDLVKRGFKFVGSTICYAFMQAAGMINDHQIDCFRYNEIKSLYK